MAREKNLLKEAIAEAKLLKETAISNAKSALEETLTPHLKSMFETKLREMDEEDDEMDLFLEAEDEDTEGTEDTKDTEGTENTEDTEDAEDAEEEINIEDMSEEDLKDFVESVVKDMAESGELEGVEGGEETEEEELEMPGEDGDEDEGLGFEIEDGETGGGEDEEINVDALINEIKRARLRESKMRKPQPRSKRIFESRKPRSKRIFESRKPKSKMSPTSNVLVKENIDLKRQIRKYQSLYEGLKNDFKDVNLLNAKLLYTNKIFKAQTLSEGQKMEILDTFDKASTIREVKLVYETLNKSLNKKKLNQKPIKERLGFASKSVKSPIREQKEQYMPQDMAVVNRFKKLAGLE